MQQFSIEFIQRTALWGYFCATWESSGCSRHPIASLKPVMVIIFVPIIKTCNSFFHNVHAFFCTRGCLFCPTKAICNRNHQPPISTETFTRCLCLPFLDLFTFTSQPTSHSTVFLCSWPHVSCFLHVSHVTLSFILRIHRACPDHNISPFSFAFNKKNNFKLPLFTFCAVSSFTESPYISRNCAFSISSS